jgi:hypothetical protein
MNVETRTEAAQFLFGEYKRVSRIFFAVYSKKKTVSSDYQLHIFSKKNTYSRNPKGSKEGPRSNLNQ